MASNALECDICCNVFSEYNSPRNLPCSHTFCGPCINGIIATQKKTCPTCREEFTATSAEELMINRIVLDVVKQFSAINLKPKTLSKGPTGSFAELPKEIRKKLTEESLQEIETGVSEAKKILDGMKDVFTATETLNEMKDGLLETKKEIGRFKEMLTDIELSIEKIVNKITESGDQLEAATDLTSTDPFHDAQEKVKEIEDLLQKNQRERDDITMEILKMRRRLGNVAKEMQKSFRVETVMVSAVKMIGGKQMVAPVRVKPGNQFRLSHFAQGDVPPKSLLVEHEALMKTSSRRAFLDLALGGTFQARIIIKVMDEGNLALNFLHLCAGDLGPSYANSQLSGVERKGQPGGLINVSTHSNSVMEVDWEKERQREIYKSTPFKAGEVRGFLSGGKASQFFVVTRDVPILDAGCMFSSPAIGSTSFSVPSIGSSGFFVPSIGSTSFSLPSLGSNNGLFNNVHRPNPNPYSLLGGFENPNSTDNYCFGIVEEGLGALKNTIFSHPNITAAQIVDCGLMFPL